MEESEYAEDYWLGMAASVSATFDESEAQGFKGSETHVSETEIFRRQTHLENERKIVQTLGELTEVWEETVEKNKDKLKNDRKFLAFTSRLTMALFSGFSLIVPMLIMYLHPTKLTNLLTTSVFVTTVAVCFAAATDWEAKDIMGATAAYAAVLVVFVGTSSTSDSFRNRNIAGIVVGVVLWLYLFVLGLAFVFAGSSIRRASVKAAGTWFRTTFGSIIRLSKTKDKQNEGD